jgi:hypothetical protein
LSFLFITVFNILVRCRAGRAVVQRYTS